MISYILCHLRISVYNTYGANEMTQVQIRDVAIANRKCDVANKRCDVANRRYAVANTNGIMLHVVLH